MAYNSWDKLSKAQSDYPKAKFAIAVVDKALKKNPKNVFLSAWKADLLLQQNEDPKNIISHLQRIYSEPGLTDTRFLSYIYRLSIEATRRSATANLGISSVGDACLKPWQNAAKTLDSRNDRLGIWDTLFSTAMREDCWEDVRFAVNKYNKEGASSMRSSHYTLILATQFTAEQMNVATTKDAYKAEIQRRVVIQLMKQSYEASPDDPIAVKDIRDLRFMAEIFRRQDQCGELFSLWDKPPAALKTLMRTHRDDLMSLKTRFLRQQENWPLLADHCFRSIEETISYLNLAQDSKPLWELCAWRWDLWESLLDAMKAVRPKEAGINKISDLMGICFGARFEAKDRPLRLTYMKARQFIGAPMLSDCKEYWEHHSAFLSCFADLRPFVEALSAEDQSVFKNFIVSGTRGIRAKLGVDKDALAQWQQAELNVLKFDYLFTVSLPETPGYDPLERLITKAIGSCIACPQSSDGGYLAIYALLYLHHEINCREDGKVPLEVTPNSRILLQATMLARHLVTRDKNKENRTLSLLAARLHLNLGLGKCAFQLYSYTKCKEMLLDTLSPYILSRISLTHPFDVKGYQSFSADEELAKVINTIERMERKTDTFIYTDMQSFVWDQAPDGLELKRKLKSSLTKHICVTERRRIARLKGQSTENLPRLDFKTYNNISDNVDRSVFPNYEDSETAGPFPIVMPTGIIDMHCLINDYGQWETASRVLYREGSWQHSDPWKTKAQQHPGMINTNSRSRAPAEIQLETLWHYITIFTEQATTSGNLSKKRYENDLQEIMNNLHAIRRMMEKLRMPGSTTLKLEDEPTMFHENMLLSCYTKLEALRALNRLVELLRERVVNAKSTHPMKTQLPKGWVDSLASETQICYESIRDVAQSYITLIRTRGEAAIKAQVRWGKTGEKLRCLLQDADVDYYTNEYVESALEAWNGVLKVKLK